MPPPDSPGDWHGDPTIPNRGAPGRAGTRAPFPALPGAPPPGTPAPVSGGRRTTSGSDSRHSQVAGGGAFPTGAILGGRFRIVGLLGRGGMGEVYRADDLTLGQSVALKFLPQSVADDPERRQGFLREVRIARDVSHPNVCRVYDIGDLDGLHYLSM
ncbi:MAG TPA: hypothetical protein VNM87_06740, partial [Candidatus Udaeobacter sp.]|nr:hypothetical protein [Candidatus Udaeobacter sp.]